MATYKKKGSKKHVNTTGNIDIIEKDSATAEVFRNLDESASKTEAWVIKNQKNIFTVLALIIIGILAYMAYQKLVVAPNEKKAADQLAFPRKYYDQATTATVAVDSLLTLGLNGADGKFGFVDIASKYSSTKAGNLASYYAGLSYLKMKKYAEAIDYLEEFDADDLVLGPVAKGSIGYAFSDINQPKDALTYYVKAANLKENAFSTPIFLMKAAKTAMSLEKFDDALKYFTRIKNDYPKTSEAKDIDMYISSAKYAKN